MAQLGRRRGLPSRGDRASTLDRRDRRDAWSSAAREGLACTRRRRRSLLQRYRLHRRAVDRARPMQGVLEVERGSGLVRVQAGITIAQLNAQLAAHGLALENLGDIDVQSIAGAISTATHGTGARLRNISSQVVAVTLVLADGSTLECSPELDPELFRAARVGLGALGVVAEVTLRCVPAFTLCGIDARRRFRRRSIASRSSALRQRALRVLRIPPQRGCADTHEQSRRGTAASARAGRGVRKRRAADQSRVRPAVSRRQADAQSHPRDQQARDAPRRQLEANRPLRPHLREPATRALHRDGVRAAARAHHACRARRSWS